MTNLRTILAFAATLAIGCIAYDTAGLAQVDRPVDVPMAPITPIAPMAPIQPISPPLAPVQMIQVPPPPKAETETHFHPHCHDHCVLLNPIDGGCTKWACK